MGALSEYLTQSAALLHDQNNLFTSQAQLTTWVNVARRNAAKRAGCIRRLITGQSAFGASAQAGVFLPGGAQPGALPGALPAVLPSSPPPPPAVTYTTTVGAASNSCQTIPGVERYPYQGFLNNFLRAEHAGCQNIMDTIAFSVNWGGALRPSLAWVPWEYLQAYARAYATLVTSFPYYWSVYNDGERGEIWLFPVPSTFGDIEADCFVSPSPLHSDDDFDAIPEGFREAIKFGVVSLVYMTKKNFAAAQLYENMFADTLGIARVSVDRGKVPNYYATDL